MLNSMLNKVQRLQQEKQEFAIAYVINRQVPSSGKPGDKAIIEKDGKLTGWVGGGCTRGIVIKEALDAINSGKSRVVNISPDQEVSTMPGVMDYRMTCQSGGSLALYIEPVLPRPHLLIMGKSHVAMALSKIAKAMDYQVDIIAKDSDQTAFPGADSILSTDADHELIQANTYIIVCTQGENDVAALEYALKSNVNYVSFISSRRKANSIFRQLRDIGFTFDDLKTIKTPAGLDINAKLPEEVAISILAEIIAELRKDPVNDELPTSAATISDNLFINPVCNIPIEKNSAKHIIRYEEKDYYFCCDGCKVKFEEDPARYAISS